MMRAERYRLELRLKGGALAALVAVIAIEVALISPQTDEFVAAAGITATIGPQPRALAVAPAEPDLSSIARHNLFDPARRGADRVPLGAAETGADAQIRLLAIVTGGEELAALVALAGHPQTERVRVGDTLAGYRILAIETDGLVLERGGKTERLAMEAVGVDIAANLGPAWTGPEGETAGSAPGEMDAPETDEADETHDMDEAEMRATLGPALVVPPIDDNPPPELRDLMAWRKSRAAITSHTAPGDKD